MTDLTRIGFASGAQLVVAENALNVSVKLTEAMKNGEPFVGFGAAAGLVHVAPTHVAYLEPAKERSATVSFGD